MARGARVGVELELLAPRGATRADLARALVPPGGRVEVFLHPDTEPALVPGTPIFDTLTLGFRVRDARGRQRARCVDDLTLQDDLDRQAAPLPGWWRLVSDDRRILQLVRRRARPERGPAAALEILARLWGTRVEAHEAGLLRVRDPEGLPLALGAPLPGERWRPCELVTPPLPFAGLHAALEALLAPARELGFTVPAEAAVHLHLDAAPFRDAAVLARLVPAIEDGMPAFKARVGTNPRCRRLGPWPPALRETVTAPGFADLPWPAAQARLRGLGLSKYVDLNLRNLVHEVPGKPTVELRVLPGSLHAGPVVEGLRAFGAILADAGVGLPFPG